MKTFRLGILFALIGILTSCSEDESTPDLVGESVRSYSYTTRVFDANNTVVRNITGSATLSRNSDDVTIIVNSGETIKTSRLELASNGYGFDIEAETLTNDKGLVNRTGKTAATLDGKSYSWQI